MVEVVSGHFDDECGASRAVALVGDFLGCFDSEFAAAFSDCAVDVVFWHGNGLGAVDGSSEARIFRRVASTGAGGKGDFMSALAKDPAFDGIDSGFDVFDL